MQISSSDEGNGMVVVEYNKEQAAKRLHSAIHDLDSHARVPKRQRTDGVNHLPCLSTLCTVFSFASGQSAFSPVIRRQSVMHDMQTIHHARQF